MNRQEYLGHTVLRKTIGTNFKTDARRFATDEERLVFENTHEPIIDNELWEQAQKGLKHAVRRLKEGTHQTDCRLPGLSIVPIAVAEWVMKFTTIKAVRNTFLTDAVTI